jgi:hypothetical protein
VLIPLGAAAVSGLCVGFAWRALRRCREIVTTGENNETDVLERSLLERERNLAFNLARRNVQALRRAALFGGTGLSFLALTGGRGYDLLPAGEAFALGFLGWGVCGELHRRIGSLADAWRATIKRKRRQGVDQLESTG